MAQRRYKETLIALLAVGVVIAAVAVVLVVLGNLGEQSPASTQPTTTATTTTTTPKPKPKPPKRVEKLPPALVVKIDNVAAARPHTGLNSADAIYVEPVEGGFTRLLAVYWGRRPSVLGPVRSVRETDIQLLAYMRRPVLAYSGSARRLAGVLKAADLVLATPKKGAFYRVGSRQIPHNMYVNPRRLPGTNRVETPLRTGPRPSGGRRDRSYHVSYRSASYDFTWRPGSKLWRVSMDGRPFTSTERGQLGASTVVVQRVRIVRGQGVRDRVGGGYSPVAKTVGAGRVTVLRDGRVYNGTWSRRTSARETTYRTSDGKPLRLASGPVWVLLVPA
jgi:hypothetical protein